MADLEERKHIWQSAISSIYEENFKTAIPLFRKCKNHSTNSVDFETVFLEEEENYIHDFDLKQSKIVNLSRTLHRENKKKSALRFLRAAIKIYKGYKDE